MGDIFLPTFTRPSWMPKIPQQVTNPGLAYTSQSTCFNVARVFPYLERPCKLQELPKTAALPDSSYILCRAGLSTLVCTYLLLYISIQRLHVFLHNQSTLYLFLDLQNINAYLQLKIFNWPHVMIYYISMEKLCAFSYKITLKSVSMWYDKNYLPFSQNIVLLNGERSHHFTLRLRTCQRHPLLSLSFNIVLKDQANVIRQEYEMKYRLEKK